MNPSIEIIGYQSRWPPEFAEIGARLRAAFGPLALAIHHIGSTSVPGLAAKDVIDVQVTVAELDPLAPLQRAIEAAGYRMRLDIGGDHAPAGADTSPALWRKRYAGAAEGQSRTNVHIRARGLPNQRYALLFRDYLRQSAPARENYALIKRTLASRDADDVDAYYDIKDPVCDLILDAAQRWADQSGWRSPDSDA